MTATASVTISGNLLGRHVDRDGVVRGEIIQVTGESRPAGPAENAFVYVDKSEASGPRARYLSWVNLYDIEHAGRQQPGAWQVVEPHPACKVETCWLPYGWAGPQFPNVADVAS
jgi:hypothetical protein